MRAKVAKFDFKKLKLREKHFLLKSEQENIKFQNPGYFVAPLPPPFSAPTARTIAVNND